MKRLHQGWEWLWDRVAASPLAQRAWAFYEAAAPRDQLALKALGLVLAALAVLALVVSPLHRFNAAAAADYREQQDVLAWMEANRHRVGERAPQAPAAPLLTLANQSAGRFGLVFRRYEPRGENGLSLVLEGVSFNRVVEWLGALEREHGVAAGDMTVTRREEPGMVDVRLILEG